MCEKRWLEIISDSWLHTATELSCNFWSCKPCLYTNSLHFQFYLWINKDNPMEAETWLASCRTGNSQVPENYIFFFAELLNTKYFWNHKTAQWSSLHAHSKSKLCWGTVSTKDIIKSISKGPNHNAAMTNLKFDFLSNVYIQNILLCINQ